VPLEADLTEHAQLRLAQRLTISENKVRKIIDKGFAVDVGSEPGFNRRHMLFYCKPDAAFFVAVQDSQTGDVITILPLDYHRNLAWEIDDKQLAKATELSAAIFQDNVFIPKTFYVSASFIDALGAQKTRQIMKWPAKGTGGNANNLFLDKAFIKEFADCLLKMSLNQIISVTVALKKGLKKDWWVFDFFDIQRILGDDGASVLFPGPSDKGDGGTPV
jgi:hypothetical protein